MSVVDRTSSEFKDAVELYSGRTCSSSAASPMRSGGGSIPTMRSATSSIATSTTQRLRRRLRVLRVLPTAQAQRGLRAELRADRPQDRECKAIGGVQILLQGGHNPYIPFQWYSTSCAISTQSAEPHPWVLAFGIVSSASDSVCRWPTWCASSTPRARQHSWRRGEILVDEVRRRMARKKAQTEEWLGVQEEAASSGNEDVGDDDVRCERATKIASSASGFASCRREQQLRGP